MTFICLPAVTLNDQCVLCYGMLCCHGNGSFKGFMVSFAVTVLLDFES